MKTEIKAIIQKLCAWFGVRISRNYVTDPFDAIRRLLGTDDQAFTLFDVGAHCGQTCSNLNEKFPAAKIFAFEPAPQSVETLKQFAKSHDKITVCPYALGDQTGEAVFHDNSFSQTNSLFATSANANEVWGVGLLETKRKIRVQVKTLDSVFSELNLSSIDLLKLDVQGAEHLVISGAAKTIKDNKIKVVFMEVLVQPTYVGQLRMDKLIGMMYDNNYTLYNLFNLNSGVDGVLRQMDAIFVHNSFQTRMTHE